MTSQFTLQPSLTNRPERPAARLLLAHGAGAPMDSPFLTQFAEKIAENGVEVVRFEFPYMAQRRAGAAKRLPDRAPVLIECWQAWYSHFASDSTPLFIGGKSMGGRIASQFVAGQLGKTNQIKGVICLGYPFHPVGRSEKTRIEHLKEFPANCLIVQGERDAFGKPHEVANYDLGENIQLRWLVSADHDFIPLKRSGLTARQCMEQAVLWVAEFISQQLAVSRSLVR